MKDYYSVYVRNQYEGASSYYRIMQYIDSIEGHFVINNAMKAKEYRHNLDIDETWRKTIIQAWYYGHMLFRTTRCLIRDIIFKPRCVILERTFLPRYSPFWFNQLIKILGNQTSIIWDFDDDIFLKGEAPERQAAILMEISRTIIVTNTHLKDLVDPSSQKKVFLLPTTDGDFREMAGIDIYAGRKKSFDDQIKLVWVATGSNIMHLERIMPYLDRIAMDIESRMGKKLVLTVVCNKSIASNVKHLQLRHILWTREVARREILAAHVGIMPLNDIPYAQGKGGFKLIQYLATGLPVIASRVGFNVEVVDEKCGCLIDPEDDADDWLQAIEKLTFSWKDWSRFSEEAYAKWTSDFSFEKNLNFWKSAIEDAM